MAEHAETVEFWKGVISGLSLAWWQPLTQKAISAAS